MSAVHSDRPSGFSREVNFDGLIGPTHNYGGLAHGNLASHRNALAVSSPKQAALQGLEKMRTLIHLGYTQGFIPPQMRPDVNVLRALGFQGARNADLIQSVAEQAPELLAMVYSASSMWAANAATVTPSADSQDGKVHFTPANLLTTAHRAIEHEQTYHHLKVIFPSTQHFAVHPALPSIHRFADEGAANHTRLTGQYGQSGLGLFVYGRDHQTDLTQLKFPARQTLESCQALARQHQLPPEQAVYLQQSADAINAGAFHNDVVAVGNGPVLFFHEQAYVPASQQNAFNELSARMDFKPVCVPADQVSLEDAIKSYLFNSQLLAGPDGDMNNMRLIAPTECEENPAVAAYLKKLVQDQAQPIRHVTFVDVRQSMSNGGGPACLRLRVVLSNEELAAVNPAFILDDQKIDRLQDWVRAHYRDKIAPNDLMDPALMVESLDALKALSELLEVGDLYSLNN